MLNHIEKIANVIVDALASRSRFVQNLRWQFVANASQALFGGVYLIAIARFLGPAEFGIFSAIMALVSTVALLFEMRLQEVVARDFCHIDEESNGKEASSLELVDLFLLEGMCRVLPALMLILLSAPMSRWINVQPESSYLLVLAAVAFTLSKIGNSVSTGLLRVLGRTDILAACLTADWVTRLILSIVAALVWPFTVPVAIAIALIAGMICNAAQCAFAFHEFSKRIAPLEIAGWSMRGALKRLRGCRRLVLSNLGISMTDLMAKDLDIVMISGVITSEGVGIYKMAKSFVQLTWRAIDPFYFAIMPEVQKLWQRKQVDELTALIRKSSMRLLVYSLALVVVGCLGISLSSHVILGPHYAKVPSLMILMSVWVVMCAPLIWSSSLAVAVNRPEYSTAGSVLGLVVGLTAFTLLTPAFGLTGAAIAWNATLISGFVCTAAMAANATRKILTSNR